MIGLKQEFWWGGGVSCNQGDVGMKTTTFFVNIWIYKHLSEKKESEKILQTRCGLPELIEIY